MAFFVFSGMQQLKIGIIGDFNFTYNTHHATNLALDHASRFLEIELSYYWIKVNEVLAMKTNQFSSFDGFWLAPGPFLNAFYLNGVVDQLMQLPVPVFITGEGFKAMLEVLIQRNNLNAGGEKLVSENLVEGNHFERLYIEPSTAALTHLYETRSTEELTATRYSMYPQLIDSLVSTEIDVEAYNQFEEPEIISLKQKNFFVACGFCPQISSTRELPHPMVYTFVKACFID
jgi:CTP synthase (UTP-ammonia lyase)